MGLMKKVLELIDEPGNVHETKKPRITARLLSATGSGLRLFGDTQSQAPNQQPGVKPDGRDKI